jgi:ABC-type uncharacterized transport system substrate-binding protein
MLATKIKHDVLLTILLIIGIAAPFFVHSSENVISYPANKSLFIFHSKNNLQNEQFYKLLTPALQQNSTFKQVKSFNTSEISQADIAKLLSGSKSCAITIGKPSLEKVLSIRDKTPIFSTLVTKNNLDHLINNYTRLGSQVSGIYQEQSFIRQLYLAQALNPKIENIIMLLGRNTRYALPHYQAISKQHSLQLLFKILNRHASPQQYLSKLKQTNAFLFIVNDFEHYSEKALQSLLLASYRQKTPLIGGKKSDSTVAAVASVYTPLVDLADEVVLNISQFCMDDVLAKAKFSEHYNVAINQQIAKYLNLEHLNEKDLKNSINLSEKTKTIGLNK